MSDSHSKTSFEPYLNVKNATAPAFAGDGQRILFLSDITGTYQVWSVRYGPQSAWPNQLTFYQERVTGLHPAPDGNSFLFSRDRGGDEQDQFWLLRGEAEQGVEITTLLDTPEYKNNFGAWRPDGQAYCFSSNRRDPAFFDIYVQEVGREPQLVYQSDSTLYARDWSPDGRYLLIGRANTNMDGDLLLLDLQQPDAEPRHLTPHQGQANYEPAYFAAGSQAIFTLTDQGRDFKGLARLELEGGELTYLKEPGWDLENLALSPDRTRLLYGMNEQGYTRLFLFEADSGREVEIEGLPRGVVSEPNWSPDGQRVAFAFNSPVHNSDVWLYEPDAGPPRRVTFSPRGGLDPARFVSPKAVRFRSFDGLEIPALLFLPPGAERWANLPFVVFVHGGPESQTRFEWNAVLQYLAGQGYGILAPNVRGSSGYGKHYLSLDDIYRRMDSVADLKAAVEWLRAEGYCDPARIAVYGGSYGGFMVLSAITTYPELWAAGVDIVGIANLVTFLENTSPYRRKLRTPEYGDPATDREFLTEISPIHKIDRIRAPLLVIHGARDPRVPVGEAEQIVAGLRERGQVVEYFRFEDEGHGITKLKNKLALYPSVADFLARYLQADSGE